MTWVLVLLFVGYKSSAMDHVEFDSQEACQSAAAVLSAETPIDYIICVPKN